MSEVFFDFPHNFNPTSSVATSNVLALLRSQANYNVVVNEPTRWIVEITAPGSTQAIGFIEFYPAAGGVFTPQSGDNPPLGVVDLIIFTQDFLSEDIFVQFQSLAALGFNASQLISDTTRLVSGDDTFFGSTFSTLGDTFFAGAGDDILFGEGGDDTLDGGAGADVLWGDDGNDALSGGVGDDIIVAGPGADNMNGGDGLDFLTYFDAAAGVAVTLATPGAAQDTGDGLDTISGFEQLEGSAFDDVLTGSNGADDLFGFNGDDDIAGGGGADILLGEFGDDTLEGGAGADFLDGGDGDDLFVQGIETSVDTLSGGAGFDLIDYSGAGAGVNVQLGAGYAASGGVLIAVFDTIEDAAGSAFDDALIGSDADNFLFGLAGSDWLVGGAGNDGFFQEIGAGVDRLFGGDGVDFIDYFSASAGVVVQLAGYATTSTGTLLATFSGIEDAYGSAFSDVLVGNGGANLLSGDSGGDWLVGGAGDDWFWQNVDTSSVDRLFGDSGIDFLDYFGASASVTVQLSGYAVSGGATIATFTGIEDVRGTDFADVLIGNGGDNVITGGAGSDWLVGGAGADTFFQAAESGVDTIFGGVSGSDSAFDTISFAGSAVGVIVQLSGYATTASGGTLLTTFAGIEGAAGSGLNDALVGNAASNTINGGAGADWLVGQGGADFFVYQGFDGNDTIADFSRTDLDRIDLSLIDTNPATLEDDDFVFSTVRTSGLAGEVVATSAGGASTVSVYLDTDNFADIVIQVIHQPGLVMNAGDFVL